MIVVTGLIGSGKSTVTSILAQSGLSVIRADEWFKTSGLVPPCKPFEDYRWELFEQQVATAFVDFVRSLKPDVVELPLSGYFDSIVLKFLESGTVWLLVVESKLRETRTAQRDTHRCRALTDQIVRVQLECKNKLDQFEYSVVDNSGSVEELETSVLEWLQTTSAG